MRRKVLLSVVLSVVVIMGTSTPALATGQVLSSETTAGTGTEAAVSESQQEAETDQIGQDDSSVSTGQESVEMQGTVEEGEVDAEVEPEEADSEEGVSQEGSSDSVVTENEEDSKVEDKTDSAVEEEKKPETMVGAEGERIVVGDNVTAEFDSETGKLTFYSQGGTLSYDWKGLMNFTFSDINGDNYYEHTLDSHEIKEITISDDSDVMYLPADSGGLFHAFPSLQLIDLSKADTSGVTDMSSMFSICSSLQTLDVSGFDTSNVTDMQYMFGECSNLEALDVSGFDTSNVTDMSQMFDRCNSLQTLNVSGFDTSNVIDMSWMFNKCSKLETLDLSGFDTSNATNMFMMFCGCSNLKTLELSGFDTSNVTDMYCMFGNCSSLEFLDLSGFNTSNVNYMQAMFIGCSGLQSLDLSGFNTSNVTSMQDMFNGCSGLQSLDLSGFNTSNVTSMQNMFNSCSNLQILDVSGFDTSNVTNMKNMFFRCSNLKMLDLDGFDTSNVTDMNGMFSGCSNLQTLDVSRIDTSNVTDVNGMFYGCRNLQILDVSGFDTSNVKDMDRMFSGCTNLQTLDVSGFCTSFVTTMIQTFYGCKNLKDLDVSSFDTLNVTSMNGMFCGCSNLQILDVDGFETSNVSDMAFMFSGCYSLQTLDLSRFDTSNVKNMSSMFSSCINLKNLDLSGCDFTSLENASNLFRACKIDTISAPINVQKAIDLPYTYVDASGTEYNILPEGLSESIRLTKKSSVSPAPVSIANAIVTGIINKIYTGTAQTQNLIVQLGDKTLTSGNDYTLSYSNNTNAGTATVTITGKENYTGTISKTFTIDKAAPVLTFASLSISKTTHDTTFTNALTKTTDGVVTFESSNTSVATVNSTSGKVTIKGSGTTTITATAAAGTNYNTGSAEYTLTVAKVQKILNITDDFYGKTGTHASFHIEAEGSGNISYQWQYRTAGMANWKSPAQESAKTADYVFKLRPSYDNIEVRCIVSDESGNEIVSETRKANVFACTSQPKDAVAEEGQVVNFEVSAIGRGITYQWYYMRPNSTWRKTTISGSKTAVLPITAGTKNDGTSYRCVITDEEGNKITSAAGTLTLEIPLQITGVSEDAYDVNGESVAFHIDAAGKGDLTYQWQYKLAGESKWRTPGQASAKTADYIFKLRPSYDNIEVRCIVKDAAGNSATSEVRKANVFAITGQPQDAQIKLGEKTTFAVEAVGKELLYQWYYMRPEGSWKKATVAGYNTAALVITANNKNDGTKFRCRITDGVGNSLVSAAATLTQS